MYGGLVGHVLTVLHLLSAGWSLERNSSIFKHGSRPPGDCTDEGLTISLVECRPTREERQGKYSFSELGRRHRFSQAGPCCKISQQGIDVSTMDLNCRSGNGSTSRNLAKVPAVFNECTRHEVRTCVGYYVQFSCNVTRSRKYRVKWRGPSGDFVALVPSLPMLDVRREDGGTYTCEATNKDDQVIQRKQVRLIVQFPPVIIVPNKNPIRSTWRKLAGLQCTAEAVPAAKVIWYRDNALIESAQYSTRSDTRNCTTRSFLEFHNYTRTASNFVNFSTDHNVLFYGNYTCTAVNDYGYDSRVIPFYGIEWEVLRVTEEEQRRPFNVTGFIVGMLPPLFISFYIILKLGYRSRYAEERGEDDGYREEPFFISY